MSTIDPPVTAGTPPAPSTTSQTRRAETPPVADAVRTRSHPLDTMDTARVPEARTEVVRSGLDAADDRSLVDEVLARLRTENDDLDDLRAAIEAVSVEREALAKRRVAVALELERTATPGIDLGQGYLDDAIWKPGVKVPGIPAETYDAAFTFANTSKLLEDSNAALTSGGGVRLLDAAERGTLRPAAFGDVFITEGDFRIDYRGHETRIYEKDESGKWQLNTRIWGDPHVDEKGTGNGDHWHFGEDSTFILPDGTKLSLNTQETRPGNGIYFTVGIDIQSGTQRGYAGQGFDGTDRNAGVAEDRVEFDEKYADTVGTSGGVFALIGDEWAKLGADGFQDVETESWQGYLNSRDANGTGEVLEVTEAQALAVSGMSARDRTAVEANQRAALATLSEHAIIGEDAINAYRGGLRSEMDRLDNQLHETSKTLAELVRLAGEQHGGLGRLDERVEETLEEAAESGEAQDSDQPARRTRQSSRTPSGGGL